MVVFMQLYSACEAFCPTAVGQKGNVRLPKDSPQAKGPPAASAFDMLGVSELALLAVGRACQRRRIRRSERGAPLDATSKAAAGKYDLSRQYVRDLIARVGNDRDELRRVAKELRVAASTL
jgi:hypothetical protein